MNRLRPDIFLFFFLLLLHAFVYPFSNLQTLTWFGNVAQGLALLLAGLHFSRTARRVTGKEIHIFNFIALGFWIFLTAHALLAYSELLLNKPATGTTTDAIWLCGYVLIARSLLLFVNKERNTVPIRLHILLLIIAAAIVTTVLWRPLHDPERSFMTKGIQVIFPFLDFWISGLAFALAKMTRSKGWLLGAFGSLIIGIADLVFPFFHQNISPIYRYLDIPLFIGYSLWWLSGKYFASKI